MRIMMISRYTLPKYTSKMQRRKNSLNSLYKVTLFYGAILEIFDEISTEIPGLVSR